MRLLILATSQRASRDPKVGKLYRSVLGGEDIGALDVTVDDTLVVEVVKALENLGNVNTDQILRKLAVLSAY